jgi:hypothetical protein
VSRSTHSFAHGILCLHGEIGQTVKRMIRRSGVEKVIESKVGVLEQLRVRQGWLKTTAR